MINISEFSHKLLLEVNNPIIACDMTCGNGHDTLFLASIAKEVYAFDIQDLAINNTSKLIESNKLSNVRVIKESHDLYDIFISKPIDLAIYNLGYLPNSDKSIKTTPRIVLNSLKKLINQLNINGVIVIVIYLHDDLESKAISDFASQLDSNYDVMKYEVINKFNCPYIIKIRRDK